MSIEVKGFDEFDRKMQKLLKEYPKRKLRLARKIGYILERNIKKLTPVDYGRLRGSITSEVTENRVETGTNIYYARWVEEGHIQEPHFVPGEFVETGNKSFRYDPDSKKGIYLKRKFIKGAFMFKKGLEKSEPQIQQELEKFMKENLEELK